MERTYRKENLAGRILAIDYGEKRIGLAVSDPLYITAQGLETIIRTKRNRSGIDEIIRIAGEYNVGLILVGLPLTLSGSRKDAAGKAEHFADELRKFVDIPIDLVDERLTSVAAKRALTEMGYKTGHRKELVDRVAAVLLLQTFLDGIHIRAGE